MTYRNPWLALILALWCLADPAAAQETPAGGLLDGPPVATDPVPDVALPSDSYDIIVLKKHHEQLYGKILMEDAQFVLFDAQTDGSVGRMKIDRARILTITYDLHRQADGLKADDLDGWFALAMKAYQSGYWSLAYDWMVKVGGLLPKDPTGEMRKAFKYAGKAADYQDKYDQALKNYVEHLKLNPEDKEISARAQEIRDYLGVVDPADAGKKKQWPNGFEEVNVYGWRAEKWGGHNTGSISDQVVPHGLEGDDHIMAISFPAGQFDKLVVGDRPAKPYNFSAATKFRISAHFKGIAKDAKTKVRPVMISLAFKSPGSGWMETDSQSVPSTEEEWTNLTFKLDGDKTFKTAETQWAFQSALMKPEQIQNVYLLIHNRQLAGNLYLNDMGVE